LSPREPLAALPPEADEAPAFAEPWEAQAFALVVELHARGLFTWAEWAESLGAELARPGARADAGDYYDRWLAALERLLARHAVTDLAEVDSLAAAWQRAAHATPHGKPILLENDPEIPAPE
jgi:nitrile hydratase accessory protein